MIVPNALSGLSNLTSLVKRSDTADIKGAAAAKAAAVAQSSPPTPTAAMREILSHYDMTDITPNDFSKLIQQLSDKGTISQKDTQELSSIRVDLENAGVGPDESVNLLEFYQQRIAKVQEAAAQSPNPGAAKADIDALVGAVELAAEIRHSASAGRAKRRERGGVSHAPGVSRYGSWPICCCIFLRSFSKYIRARRWRKCRRSIRA